MAGKSVAEAAATKLEDFAFDHVAQHVIDHPTMVSKSFHAMAHFLAELVHADHLPTVLAHLKTARDTALAHPAVEPSTPADSPAEALVTS